MLWLTFNDMMILFLQLRQRNPEPMALARAFSPSSPMGEMCHKDVRCGIGFAPSPFGAADSSVTFCSCQNLFFPTPLLGTLHFLEIQRGRNLLTLPVPQTQKLFPNASSISDLRGRLEAAPSCNLYTC